MLKILEMKIRELKFDWKDKTKTNFSKENETKFKILQYKRSKQNERLQIVLSSIFHNYQIIIPRILSDKL